MYKTISGLATAIILVVLSVRYLDLGIATLIAEHMGRKFLFSHGVSNLPDQLLIFVIVASTFCWSGYFFLAHRGIYDRRSLFCQITGTSLPLAFAAKGILKWAFGRTDTRMWLTEPNLYAFHWFHGGQGFQGFPSGHMLVLTPLFLALIDFFPRHRLPVLVAWSGLGLALMITEYHFLGDVLAGACFGFLVHFGAKRYFTSRG